MRLQKHQFGVGQEARALATDCYALPRDPGESLFSNVSLTLPHGTYGAWLSHEVA